MRRGNLKAKSEKSQREPQLREENKALVNQEERCLLLKNKKSAMRNEEEMAAKSREDSLNIETIFYSEEKRERGWDSFIRLAGIYRA